MAHGAFGLIEINQNDAVRSGSAARFFGCGQKASDGLKAGDNFLPVKIAGQRMSTDGACAPLVKQPFQPRKV